MPRYFKIGCWGINVDFWRGWLALLRIESLFQDLLGQERYVAWLQHWGWCPGWISVPVAVVVLVLVSVKFVTREEIKSV